MFTIYTFDGLFIVLEWNEISWVDPRILLSFL